MVTIKEAEMQTGITKQNIRYYEKIGLLQPSREQENKYRNYSEEDIRRLKLIFLFRKLDMPLEEIRQLLEGTIELQDALQMQKEMLVERQQKLQAAISFCGQIEEKELTQLDVDEYLSKIKTEEKNGHYFADILQDYKKVLQSESLREFSFSPEDFCTTPRQMTEQLFLYAEQHHLNLVITKEGMYPEFTIDGREYRAYRVCGRMGMVIHGELLHPELYKPENIPEKRYQILRMISKLMIPVLIFLLVFLPRILPLLKDDLLNAAVSLLGLAGFAAYLVYLAILYKNYDS